MSAEAPVGLPSARNVAFGTAMLALVACGPALVWHRPGMTDAEYRQDDAECRGRAEVEKAVPTVRRSRRVGDESIELAPRTSFDFEAYRTCMQSRGYRLVPKQGGT